MTSWSWPVCAVALVLGMAPAARAVDGAKPVRAPRVYGPAAPAAPRVYGPHPAPEVAKHSAVPPAKASAPVTDKVASSTESTKPGNRGESTGSAASKAAQTDPARGDAKTRSITIYFVQGEEKQSIVEFALPVAGGQAAGSTLQRAMTFEATNIEADVDGKLLLRGDVRIRFANGLRLGAQLVAVTTSRDEGPVEIVVKE
jgi:hypothetical protein